MNSARRSAALLALLSLFAGPGAAYAQRAGQYGAEAAPTPTQVQLALQNAQAGRSNVQAAEQVQAQAQQALFAATNSTKKQQDVQGLQGAIGDIQKAKSDYEKAMAEKARAEEAYRRSGSEYVRAEEAYIRKNGTPYNPSEYHRWRQAFGSYGAVSSVGHEPASAGGVEYSRPANTSPLLPPRGTREEHAAAAAGSTTGRAPTAAAKAQEAPPNAWLDRKILISDSATLETLKEGSDAKAQYDGAAQLMNIGDHQGALRSVDRLIERRPNDAGPRVLKARILNKMGRFKDAEESAKKAVELDPERGEAYERLTEAQLMQGKYKEAAENATTALRLDPENAYAYHLRALAHEGLGRRERMLADLERAAQRDPERFSEELRLGRSGERLFDPKRQDAWQLLEAVSARPERRRGGSLPTLMLVFGGLAGAAGMILIILRSRRRPVLPSPEESALEEGELADMRVGKYELLRVIGRGGMGQVWEARDASLDRRVAVKLLFSAGSGEADAREQALREARTHAALSHPHIVEIYEVLDRPEGIYLVFEFLAGQTLQQILAEKKSLPPGEARRILEPVCDALAYAHSKGVVHRDLKPSNIMLIERGHVKVMDFGIARRIVPGSKEAEQTAPEDLATGGGPEGPRLDEALLARTRNIAGTPAYMPPEADEGIYSPFSDVYCLGVCLYEMLTGIAPFGPDAGLQKIEKAFMKAGALVRGLPPEADALIDEALEPVWRRRISLLDFRARLALLGPLPPPPAAPPTI